MNLVVIFITIPVAMTSKFTRPQQVLVLRCGMLRYSLIKNNPVVGVGPGNMGFAMNALVEKKMVNQAIYRNPDIRGIHVHNAYLEIMGTQGIIGFSALLLILFYPLYIFIHNKNYDRRIASLGILCYKWFYGFFINRNSVYSR